MRTVQRHVGVGLVGPPPRQNDWRVKKIGGQGWCVVVDGEEGSEFSKIGDGSLSFSQNGENVGFVAWKDDAWHVIVNETRVRKYEDDPSPDGFRAAVTEALIGEQSSVR